MTDVRKFLFEALEDPDNGWSIGTFGAIGEFVRDPSEPAERCDDGATVVTARGGIRLSPQGDLQVVAYDTLVGDGKTWGNAVAFCLPVPAGAPRRAVRRIGEDRGALHAADRDAILYDLGVGAGHVAMGLRTRHPDLIAALDALGGKTLLGPDGKAASELIRQRGPNRVMLSPLGRIEVFAPIPPPDGKSPTGPHTHLLPKLIASGRTHSANAPIPDDLQPALMLHPRSPWRDTEGKLGPYDQDRDRHFDGMLAACGLAEDRAVRAAVEAAVKDGASPDLFAPPKTRRGRTQLRITLRRLAQTLGTDAVAPRKALYDPVALDEDDPLAHG